MAAGKGLPALPKIFLAAGRKGLRPLPKIFLAAGREGLRPLPTTPTIIHYFGGKWEGVISHFALFTPQAAREMV